MVIGDGVEARFQCWQVLRRSRLYYVVYNRGWPVGSALTFSQMSFIAVQALPSFITFRTKARGWNWIPRLKPRAIPLSTWLVQVLLFVFMSLLNNWAFAYRVPLTVQIVIRSSGKPFPSCRSVCCVCYLVIQFDSYP